MPSLHELTRLGQGVWLDYIRRSFIDSGELQELIDQGLTGITSNPTILDKAIAGSNDYDQQIGDLAAKAKSTTAIYEAIVTDDIRRAADLLRPVFDRTNGYDGFVSLEVSPTIAHDTQATTDSAKHLFKMLNRPNVMIKVPATQECIPAVHFLTSIGININITLMFSLEQYLAVAEAYISGLEKLAESGGDVSKVASVASFFVSRIDTVVDAALEKIGEKQLQGRIAIANAKVVYTHFHRLFSGPRWQRLAYMGARVQRPLWASTSTKNPNYPDTLYVDNLIGADTVNTLPLATIHAFVDHGKAVLTMENGLEDTKTDLYKLAGLGIDLDKITRELLDDGIKQFADAFAYLNNSIAEKFNQQLSGWQASKAAQSNLGRHQQQVDRAVEQLKSENIAARIWRLDHTVWKPEPKEITNRLGWLHSPEIMGEHIQQLENLADELRNSGYNRAVLLGMGGSSLAPEVFRRTFGVKPGYLDLSILDSTVPGAVLSCEKELQPERTLFIVSTKSGGTVETLSLFKHFYNWVLAALDEDEVGMHFIAITDPGSSLAELAARYDFRATFLNDPNIGGRYSALSHFGLVPAALIGADLRRLLSSALRASCAAEACVPLETNPALWLGAVLGEMAKAGRDKVTFVLSPQIVSFADWVEQLIAESTGKEGKGILPVVGEPLGDPSVYGDDRLFVSIHLPDDHTHDAALSKLEQAGHPLVRLELPDIYDLGWQMFLWEMATAVAGHLLGINPFDQPNVESAKVSAREIIASYAASGSLPVDKPALETETVQIYGNIKADTPQEALSQFIASAQPGAYLAIQAYLERTTEDEAALAMLRLHLRDRTRLATTVGFGPRFLHSTGQLHKGDAGKGLFIQFTADDPEDIPIPDEAGNPASSISFGVLKTAQALGDCQALEKAGRRVIHFHLKGNIANIIGDLIKTG
jgi:transaldolase / glucose-6-phosphate isomerase